MKKILLTITLIMILFLTFSSVQAADSNLNMSSSSQNVVDEKTFSAIQTTIDDSNPFDTVVLEGTYFPSSGKAINIDKPITIKGTGKGASLIGNSKDRTLNIYADNVTVENIIFAGVSGTSTHQSGAIYATGHNLNIINCQFIANQAQYGAAIESEGNNVVIKNCQFSSNIADVSGGAVELIGDNNYLSDCVFENNYGGHVGGDISWVGNNGTLTGSVFKNSNPKDQISQFGSSVMWIGSNGVLTKSSFSCYYAKINGSAVYWRGSNGTLNYCIFEKRNPDNISVIYGNPETFNNNYWGVNINSSDEFINQQLIGYDSSFIAPKNWVNIVTHGNIVNFELNNGETLTDYLPDYKYNSIVISKNIFDGRNPTSFTSSDVVTYSLYSGKYLKIVLTDENNKKLTNKEVYILLNGVSYKRITDNDGAVSFKINLKNPKTYKIQISFKGDFDYKASNKNVKIIVKKQKPSLTLKTKTLKLKNKKKIIHIQFKDQFKKAISKAKVKITINKKTYVAKTNSKGFASFKVVLKTKNKYKLTAKFAGGKYYKAVSKTGYVRVK